MHTRHFALAASLLLSAACASDGTTAPASTLPAADARLSAVASVITTRPGSDPVVALNVVVTSTLPETVSGGVCAEVVQARAASGTAWSDVSSTAVPCSMIAVILAPGGNLNISAYADAAKLRAVAGGTGSNAVVRVRHTLSGSSTNYVMQSNDVTVIAP